MEKAAGKESKEKKEYTASAEAIEAFLHISEDSLNQLSTRLQSAEGHARIWVHPLYTEQWPGSTSGRLGAADLKDVQEKLRSAFLRTVESVHKNPASSPLVVYEAVKMLEATKKIVASHIGVLPEDLPKFGIVFVPTEASSSFIDDASLAGALGQGNAHEKAEGERIREYMATVDEYVATIQKHSEELKQMGMGEDALSFFSHPPEKREARLAIVTKHQEETKPLRKKFSTMSSTYRLQSNEFMLALYKKLGLRSALVSGAYMEVDKDSYGKPELRACAGGVVDNLRSAHIPTDISSNIWPPKELIKAAGIPFKETGAEP